MDFHTQEENHYLYTFKLNNFSSDFLIYIEKEKSLFTFFSFLLPELI